MGIIQALSALAIAALTAVLVLANLRYVKLTRQIATAAIEQGEALQKPCVALRSDPREGNDAILNAPHVCQVARTPTVQLINLGPGPALKVRYSLAQTNAADVKLNVTGFLDYLESHARRETQLVRNLLVNRTFTYRAEYESLSGAAYVTEVRLEEGGVIVSFDFKKAR